MHECAYLLRPYGVGTLSSLAPPPGGCPCSCPRRRPQFAQHILLHVSELACLRANKRVMQTRAMTATISPATPALSAALRRTREAPSSGANHVVAVRFFCSCFLNKLQQNCDEELRAPAALLRLQLRGERARADRRVFERTLQLVHDICESCQKEEALQSSQAGFFVPLSSVSSVCDP